MLWLGGLHALDLTTSTPDALCPPLEEAREAVRTRVGDVRGDFQAEFGLIRRDDGQPALELLLREGAEEVLHRELPLDDAGCDSAAQAIALVLERYFDALESPAPKAAAPQLESPPIAAAPLPAQVASHLPASPRVRAANADAPASASPWRARAGFLYDRELKLAPTLGVTLYPHAWQLTPRVRVGAALDVAIFLSQNEESVRSEQLTLSSAQAALSLPLTLQLSSWEISAGPWAHWRLQRAEAPAEIQGATQYRALPGFGGFTQLSVKWGGRWSLGAGLALGAQLRGSAARFVLQGDNGERNAVLVPDAWFLQASLAAGLTF